VLAVQLSLSKAPPRSMTLNNPFSTRFEFNSCGEAWQ
jgi:hypothetical protein